MTVGPNRIPLRASAVLANVMPSLEMLLLSARPNRLKNNASVDS
jgi:hypothetical protein